MIPLLGIPLLALLMVVVVLVIIDRSRSTSGVDEPTRLRRLRRDVGVVAAWFCAVLVLAGTGVLRSANGAPGAVLFAGSGVAMFVLALSQWGKPLSHHVGIATLVGLHAFRLPLELVMHQAGNEGVMPTVMSWQGRNPDIVTGVVATLLWLLSRWRTLPAAVVVAFNVLGTLMLVNVLQVAVRASPVLMAFGPDQVNRWVLEAPYVLLPTVLVAIAWLLHVSLWRRLLQR
jgi:hypothetical protein